MEDLIISIYGKDQKEDLITRINALIESYSPGKSKTDTPEQGTEVSPVPGRQEFTQEDAILITYPDQLSDNKDSSLGVLHRFLQTYVGRRINTVHILPFFPYSSDDGFSIIDFYAADPAYGGWQGVRELAKDYGIMCDLVLNHISAQSSWFTGFLRGEPEYANFFITADPEADLSSVTRPRPYPLLTAFDTHEGKQWLWTTFSTDQIDLNFKNPDVFIEMANILLWYVSKGADIIRLDAIAYIWKEEGTNCIHRPEVHKIVKLFRAILDRLCPRVVLITETNVPHEENISYFGNGTDEAQMVYQFPLPPLIAHALIMEKGSYLTAWAATLSTPHPRATYFNFTASHDGIGVRPLQGLVPDEDLVKLVEMTRERGGDVSYKTDSDGNKSPYELNINYLSILSDPGEPVSVSIQRFLLSQSIMLTMPGVPGIYFHSLVGSQNDTKGVERTGALRSINRKKLILDDLEEELATNETRKKIFHAYVNMLGIRQKEKAFHPRVPFTIHQVHEQIFALERIPGHGSPILAIHNLGSGTITNVSFQISPGIREFTCLLTGQDIKVNEENRITITLPPYHFLWLRGK